MVSRICKKAVKTTLVGLRELALILGLGILGGQLVISLNGGLPNGVKAEAASSTPESTPAVISSIQYELNPLDPAELKSIQLSVSLPDGSAPQALRIALSPDSRSTFPCQHNYRRLWTCPTPGISVAELENIIAMGY